ncbi:MAG: DUF1636 family protein [Gammaproteobacteria bacterium]|nr:DUF1636 family protein [Gammaproteobacteria bacterium]MCP5199522.1 DUF1636 family protein [Gammaproteobacteria bacterium]
MPRLVFVCRTCDRYAPPGSAAARRGAELVEALRAQAAQYRLEVREVACLSGCLEPANLGLRGAGRSTLRFSAVSVADVDAFLACARDYWAAPLAADVRKLIPRRLRRKAQVIGPVRA